ncbi:ATP-dependent RNA helicase dbp10-like protein [Elsinoe fawcettii]|nr:ATP-dependent RNA helicase dbp10-like protein [Elsinoe fawcettii]
MRRRSVSPTLSTSGFDISGALAGGSDGEEEVVPDTVNSNGSAKVNIENDSDSDDAFIAAQQVATNRKNAKQSSSKKGGSFQSFGLNSKLLSAITRKGFNVPTPIQRKTIPVILDGQDVVGMARTGSGKTAAFVIPMLEKLKVHSARVGARAVILSPSRELALQTLKVVKELGKGTDLRTILLVGGDSLEEQFGSMASNPDIIIATPGRFEHLKVEMGLELSSVKYVVFDEADRLFEMGFAAQLTEIIHALPPSRQTLLFSATLPKSLVEFARAGLQEPKLVRLDSESKISPDLQSAFFMLNSGEKEGALVHILRDVIKMPSGPTEAARKQREAAETDSKKRKRGQDRPSARETPTAHSTIVFASTKHHVDYLAALLKKVGFATSYVYGSLDQTARKMQVDDFRTGITNILVVTDVAARGIDIPILANVINYDFPPQPKVFIHRVGRTARAGKQGWSYNLVTQSELPYLLDLQLFLGGKLFLGREASGNINYHNDISIGSLSREALERNMEEVAKLVDEDDDIYAQKEVSQKGEKQYLRTRNSASAESAKRSKAVSGSNHLRELHPLFEESTDVNLDIAREQMLARVSGFRPQETIFEIGRRGQITEAAEVIKKRRQRINSKPKKQDEEIDEAGAGPDSDAADGATIAQLEQADSDDLPFDEASDSELEITISQPSSKRSKRSDPSSFQDSEHFMGYLPTSINMQEDAGYSVNPSSSNFVTAARSATLDLNADESASFALASKPTGLRWDKKSKRYVARANDMDGSRTGANGKGAIIRGESGNKLPASLKSGRFEAWKKANRVSVLPRVGEQEKAGTKFGSEGGRYRHKQTKAPKEADKYRDDYYKRKKQVAAAKERGGPAAGGPGGKKGGKGELRGVDDVRKLRAQQAKKKEKNARPSRRKSGKAEQYMRVTDKKMEPAESSTFRRDESASFSVRLVKEKQGSATVTVFNVERESGHLIFHRIGCHRVVDLIAKAKEEDERGSENPGPSVLQDVMGEFYGREHLFAVDYNAIADGQNKKFPDLVLYVMYISLGKLMPKEAIALGAAIKEGAKFAL